MYKSPIEIFETPMETIVRDLRNQRENTIVAEISVQLGVAVDKGELIRALQYDRQQYDKGFADGVKVERAELFDEIEQELNAALENNTRAKREHSLLTDKYDDVSHYLAGKIDTLRGLLYWLDEIKKKYGVTDDEV